MSEQAARTTTTGAPATADPVIHPEDAIIAMDQDASADPGGTGDSAGVSSEVSGEVELQCPGCGLTVLGEQPRPTAAWFCPRCDYPLFWAADAPEPPKPASRAARHRLPGANGRQTLGAEPCWHCGEMTEPGDRECGRCAATLPKPRAPHVEVPYPVHVPVPVAIRTTVWPFLVAGVLGGAAIASALATWLTGA